MAKLRLSALDMDACCKDKEEYETKLKPLQLKMLQIQQTYYHEKRRGIVVVEGWDAAGKGGMIRRLVEKLDPRGVKVWPIGPPDPVEQGRHYLYRFWAKLPEPGTLAVFDRSWYGRVLVERVEGLARKPAWKRAYDEINDFERMLIDDGVRVAKVFLHITPDEQRKRFIERLENPYKRWKLTPADIRSHQRWADYVEAIEDMFDRTSPKAARWTAIPANHKWYARLASIERICDVLARDVDLSPPAVDPAVTELALGWLKDTKSRKRK
jgi:AMP-polyphosphate phosphotransferase